MRRPIYLDCHSTTPVDRVVLEAILPWFSDQFGNAGSHSHRWGEQARSAVESARATMAGCLRCRADEIVFTSGATESNNLAIFGVAEKLKKRKNRLITTALEHPSVLDPLQRLGAQGWEVVLTPVNDFQSEAAGTIDLEALESSLNSETAFVSIAVANNEIGTLQSISEIADLVHSFGALLHVDASQAVGWMDISIEAWKADLISFSAHKFYGPKGVGALFVRGEDYYPNARPVRLTARAVGGGQEGGRRSGTLNTAGIVGLGAAMEVAFESRQDVVGYVAGLRNLFWETLQAKVDGGIWLNGPAWNDRSPNNLNFRVDGIEGQTIMALAPELAMSSGSACSSAEPGVSSVLTGIGLSEDQARCSLRIGLGKFHTVDDIQTAAQILSEVIAGQR